MSIDRRTLLGYSALAGVGVPLAGGAGAVVAAPAEADPAYGPDPA